MLIFDTFPDQKAADSFAIRVRDTFGRSTRLCWSQEESNRHDPFPFVLTPQIVLVERDGDDGPQLVTLIEDLVVEFGGRFAGT